MSHDIDEIDSADVDWKATAENLQVEITRMQRVIRWYVAAVEDGARFDALVDLVPGLKSGDTASTADQRENTVRVGDPDPCNYDGAQSFCEALDGGYVCTRGPGHSGQHMAGAMQTVVRVWPNEAAS